MFSEKLLSILQTLSKVERNRFRKYLLSPYLNDQPDLILLFDAADKALRDGSFTQLERQQVWQKLYPVSYTHLDVYKRQVLDSAPF